MRIIALASALLLLGASVALAQSGYPIPTPGSSGSSGSSGSQAPSAPASGSTTGSSGGQTTGGAAAGGVAAAAAAAGAHSNSATTGTNPLQGATAGTPAVSPAVPQTQYQPAVIEMPLSDGFQAQLWGTQLFTGAFAGTRPADRPDYLLQPGDSLVINLYGAINSGGNQVIDPTGNVFVVGVGPVHVGGIPASQLQTVIQTAVGKVFTTAVSVYTAVSNAGTIGVYVAGDAVRPGRYLGGAHDSILFYLNAAEGIDANGTYRDVVIKRAGQVVAHYDLYDFLTEGNVAPFTFQDGDTIFVGPRGPVVGATGAMDFPDIFEAPAHRPMTGADLIRLGRPQPTMTGVVVKGFRNGAPREAFFTIDEFARVVLGDEDHVMFTVSGYRDTISVTIEGDVQGPTAYVLPRGAELSQLLAKVPMQGTQVEARWVHIQRPSVALEQKQAITDELYRIQKAVLTSSPPTNSSAQLATAQATLINQFVTQAATITPTGNIAVYTNGQFHDLMLEDGDVVILPNRTDVILVNGEVENAGALVNVPGMTIDGYVNRAGGYAAHANKKRFVLLHADGSGVVAGPHDRPEPGDQILVLPNVGNENLQVFIDLTTLFFQLALSAATVISVSHAL
jgi:protein involved in polysaccharide export with SLBB domain